MQTVETPPAPGDRCPDFLLPPRDGALQTFHERHIGRPAALVLARDAAALDAFADLADTGAVHALLPGPDGAAVAAAIPAQHDHGGLARDLDGGAESAGIVVRLIDDRMRLRQRLAGAGATGSAVRVALASLQSCGSAGAPVVRRSAAPVLIVPDVLDCALCARLIAAHAADHAASGMLRRVADRMVLVPDARAKQRLDHRLTDPVLVQAVRDAIVERVLPEIDAAFHYPVTRMEGFKVAAYDASAGWFRLHRDNSTPDTAHRRFALTLALDDDFDGGALHFPEHDPNLHRPPAGGAIVFSGTLLHEVTDVTRDRRHVLLTFLWGNEAGR